MNIFHIKFNRRGVEKFDDVKNELKSIGSFIRSGHEEHRNGLRAIIEKRIPEQNSAAKQIRKKPRNFWKPLLFSGASLTAVFVLAIVLSPMRNGGPIANEPFEVTLQDTAGDVVFRSEQKAGSTSEDVSFAVEDEKLLEVASGGAPDYYEPVGVRSIAPKNYQTPTFTDTFQQNIGNHDASEGDMIEYQNEHGDMLEVETQFHILTRRDEASDFVQDIMNGFGGRVSGVQAYGNSVTITGSVPKDQLALFREQVKDLSKGEAFFRETQSAYDRTGDAIYIDEKVQEVIDAIALLEKRIAEETDEQARQDLETELAEHKRYLAERQDVQENLSDRVEYADVFVTIEQLESIWRATDMADVRLAVAGFEEPTIFQRMIINIGFLTAWFLLALSMTFWFVIPIAIWLIIRRKKKRRLIELE